MWNILLFAVLSLFVLGCSDTVSDSVGIENEKAYLSIARAPINSEVSITQKIVLDFSTELNVSSVTTESVYILDESNSSVGLFLGVDGFKVLFTPYQYLKPSHVYTIVVTTDVKSSLGLSLSKNFTFSFTTAAAVTDTTPITFVDVKPSSASAADPNTDISIGFSKNISPDSQYNGTELIRVTNSSGTAVGGELNFFNSIVSFKPSQPLNTNAIYNISLVGDVTDMYGNVYAGTKSWSFTTASTALPTSEEIYSGYRSVSSYDLNNTSASIIRSVKRYDGNQSVAVAYQNTVEIFDLLYNSRSLPYLKKKYTYTVPSQINAMVYFNDAEPLYYDIADQSFVNEQFIGVGTMNDGVYILKVDSTGVSEFVHSPSSSPISGVTYSRKSDENASYIHRFYSVGPEYGISAFDVDDNQTLVDIAHTAVTGIPIKVAAAVDNNYTNVVYVTDYSGNLLKFDENCTLLGSVSLNGSTRDIVVTKDMYGYDNGVLAINSIGQGSHIDLDAQMSTKDSIEIISSARDISSFGKYDNNTLNYTSRVHISDPSNGLIVYKNDTNLTAESIIKSGGHIVSSTFLGDYIATLDQEGIINIFNSTYEPDTQAPYLVDAWDIELTPGEYDISANFNEAVDPTTVSANSFVLTNITYASSPVDVTFILQAGDTPDLFYFLGANLVTNNWYELKVLAGVKDMVGNDVDTNTTLQFQYFGF